MASYLKLILIITFYGSAMSINDSLVAVHLIFRHGDRCPEQNNLYKSSPYYNESYFKPYGFGQLTNKGKLRAYNIGKEIRQRYTGFLEESYNRNLIDARSSDFNRTKESLQAMLAGLFPPTEELTWLPGLNWQPIAYNYVERSSDKELFCFGCPAWDPTLEKYLKTKEGLTFLKKFKNLFQYLTNKTGEPYQMLEAYYLYFGFRILEEFNYTLPEWSKSVYPDQLKNLTTDYYTMITKTSALRQMSGGYLLKKILSDTQEKIDATIPKKKMFIWCAHENNIGAILNIMDVEDGDMVNYGSYIIFELHNLNDTYGFKIFYKNNGNEPNLLKLPKCKEFCPLETFKHLIRSDIPEDNSVCRGHTASSSPSLQEHLRLEYTILSILCIWLFSKYYV